VSGRATLRPAGQDASGCRRLEITISEVGTPTAEAATRDCRRSTQSRAVFASGWPCSWRTWAIPIDIVPDLIPVLGYADDAIIVTLVLRSTVRRAGLDAVRARWPGTDDGFAALCRLVGLR
jgi:hypothetical protein